LAVDQCWRIPGGGTGYLPGLRAFYCSNTKRFEVFVDTGFGGLFMTEKVVITGTGTINPLGHNVEDTWNNIINGVSGVAPITLFDATDFLVKVACEVKDFEVTDFLSAREARRLDRFEQYALIAAQQAMEQSGLEITPENAARVGVIVSSAIGGFQSLQDASIQLPEEGPRKVSPFLITMIMPNGASGLIGIQTGAKGPTFSVASACASGSDGIGTAWNLIRSGAIDAAITGASDATIAPLAVAAFDRVRAMSRKEADLPQPFDRDRDGLVMGEGAAVLVIESESHARSRGAEILGEIAGYGSTADAFHVTAPSENGAGGAAAMRLAMQHAGVSPEDVDYINAHGTATPLNDEAETKAIKAAFGERAYDIPISSTKSMTGHMMGTTGALEAIFCLNAVRQGILPPTINYHNPDPICDLDYIPNTAREAPVKTALSNAFGFGGHNAVLCIRAYGNSR
jgi:3-oxoacyl-[acyl-carrier-protein] synthase II